MDRKEAIRRIMTASNIICYEDKANEWATSILVDYILSHRMAEGTLERWTEELEGMAKRAQEANDNG